MVCNYAGEGGQYKRWVGWFQIHTSVEFCCGKKEGHCCTISTNQVKPSWPRCAPHTLYYCRRREMQPHRMTRNPSKHHWAVVFREVALLWSTIDEIDLKTGYHLARGPACRIRWIWLRFGGFLVTLSSQLQLRPSQPHALPQEKYSADFEAALISKCVFPDLYFSKNLCLGMRVNFGLRVICGRFLCNYSCPPQSNIKTMTGCYWELGTVSCPRERKIEMWLSLLDAQAIPYKNHYFNLTSGSDTPHSRT